MSDMMNIQVDENKLIKARMGLNVTGDNASEYGGLGEDSMAQLMEKATAATAKKKRDRSKNAPKRKRGGQPGNKNAGGGATAKGGIYLNALGQKQFESRFQGYSKALGKASAMEEVAVIRAMLMNLLRGLDPMGIGPIDDPELLTAYTRDMLTLFVKAKDLAIKEEAKRLEQEEKKGRNAGIRIQFTSEMDKALNGMVDAQDGVGVSAEELMKQAQERIETLEAEKAAALEAAEAAEE